MCVCLCVSRLLSPPPCGRGRLVEPVDQAAVQLVGSLRLHGVPEDQHQDDPGRATAVAGPTLHHGQQLLRAVPPPDHLGTAGTGLVERGGGEGKEREEWSTRQRGSESGWRWTLLFLALPKTKKVGKRKTNQLD